MDFVFCMVAGAANFSKDMSDLRIVIFLKFVRFGDNLAQTIVLGYLLVIKA